MEDYLRPCRLQLQSQTSLVCFREGSDEIVGLNVTYVTMENDPISDHIMKAVNTLIGYASL